MKTGKIEILARRSVRANAIELLLLEHRPNGGLGAGRNIIIESVDEGAYLEPTAVISIPEAQFLLDELWNCGLRPSDGSGNAGQLGATERHLSDMRKIVSGVLKGVDL